MTQEHPDQINVTPNRRQIAESTGGVVNAARWFWWIAGLSLINTVLMHSGSDTSFVVGLGFTLIADAVFVEIPVIAYAFDAVVLGFFVFMGLFAQRGYIWAFVVGGFIYLLDALIYLYFGDYLALGFHAFALFQIVTGAIALRTALKEAANPPVIAPETPTE